VFIGVYVGGISTEEMVLKMNDDPIIFAMAHPESESMQNEAKAEGTKVIGTRRYELPNQGNHVLALPGLFRGALDVRATRINEKMKIAAAEAIASLSGDDELHEDYVIPAPFDERVAPSVAANVAQAAMESGVA